MQNRKTDQHNRQKRFGRALAHERSVDGLTQQQVAERREHHVSMVSDHENGDRPMPVSRVGEGGPHELRAMVHHGLAQLDLDNQVAVLTRVISSIARDCPSSMRLHVLEELRESIEDEKTAVRAAARPGLRSVRPSSGTTLKAV